MTKDGQLSFSLGTSPKTPAEKTVYASRNYKVPYAHAQPPVRGRVPVFIIPEKAIGGRDYWCPECGQAVRKRRTSENQHFYHQKSSKKCGLDGESEAHILAKHLVVRAVLRWQAGEADKPTFRLTCSKGHTTAHDIPDATHSATSIDNSSTDELEQFDILLRDTNGATQMAIRILERRGRKPPNDDLMAEIPIIELKSDPVLREAPWIHIGKWTPNGYGCPRCQE